MEALVVRATRAGIMLCLLFVTMGASHRTQNFIVTARTTTLAKEIAQAAEQYRSQLAVEWLGRELPAWREPCPIQANVNARLGAGGATSFLFQHRPRQSSRPVSHVGRPLHAEPAGRPYGWEMTLQGSRERVLDSVLPHEVTHTIFATHFGRPLPRWADEGACTTVEHASEKDKQHRFLYEFLTTNRGIPFNRMFAMKEYPADILPLYSQGFSLARYLIAQGGRQKFVKYVGRGLDTNDWTSATREFYGFDSLSDLQLTWVEWVRQGSPASLARIASTPKSPQSKQMPNQETVSGSWYLARSQQARRHTPHATRVRGGSTGWEAVGRSVPDGRSKLEARAASRPAQTQDTREVLIEWGPSSPFLAPNLALQSRDRDTTRATLPIRR